MDFVNRMFAPIERRMSIADLDAMMDTVMGGAPTYTGKAVSQTNALQVSAVWASIRVLSDDLATLPFLTFRQLDNGRELAKEHYLWGLLQEEANPELTSWRFKQLMQTWVLLWGNAYAEMEINGRGQITALWPWRPDRVKVSRAGSQTGPLQYTYQMQGGKEFTLPHDRIFHLRGLGLDGVMGLSPIEVHKQTIGLSMAVTEHGARFFGNGARPLGLLEHPGKLGDKALAGLRKSWADQHQGLSNAHRLAILEEGMKYQEVGSSMVDAQYLEVMGFTVTDIARIFGVPPHRIADLARSTNNNIEHQGLEYVQYGIGPWATNWEQEICSAMLSLRDRSTIHVKANFRNLLRGDHKSMGDFIGVLIDRGVCSADEIRDEFLDMNPQPGGLGKKYFKPVNMAPVSAESHVPAAPAATGIAPMVPSKPSGKPNGVAPH